MYVRTFLILSFLLPVASAHAADQPADAKGTVERVLLEPLAQNEERRSRFARSYQPPRLRTVQLVDNKAHRDASGAEFFIFKIDESRGVARVVNKDALQGCVYPESNAVYVKRGEAHYPAAFLLGKTNEKASAEVCVDAPAARRS